MKRGPVVIISGLIASGKSTLSRELSKALGPNTLLLNEPDEKEDVTGNVGNPYLASYYTDPKRFSFTMQVHLLAYRYRQHLQAQWHAMNTGNATVGDSSFYSDVSFARLQYKTGLLDEREYNTYQSLFQAMTASVLLPTVCVRVIVAPEIAQERMRKRMEIQTGRKCEDVISLEYLKGLDREIDYMVNVLRQSGVTVIDVDWNEDRGTEELRASMVQSIAERIKNINSPDPFTDLYRRTI